MRESLRLLLWFVPPHRAEPGSDTRNNTRCRARPRWSSDSDQPISTCSASADEGPKEADAPAARKQWDERQNDHRLLTSRRAASPASARSSPSRNLPQRPSPPSPPSPPSSRRLQKAARSRLRSRGTPASPQQRCSTTALPTMMTMTMMVTGPVYPRTRAACGPRLQPQPLDAVGVQHPQAPRNPLRLSPAALAMLSVRSMR
jgi:hypothetical protein